MLDETIFDARMLVLREVKLLPVVDDSHPTLVAFKDPDLKERVRKKTKEILIDDELRRRRYAERCLLSGLWVARQWGWADLAGGYWLAESRR